MGPCSVSRGGFAAFRRRRDRRAGGSDSSDGISMDSLIAAAGRALAAGDPLAALNRVALRDDPPALALRGIAMAQLGDLGRARELLGRAARAFGANEPVARARCRLAEAEIALVSRDLGPVGRRAQGGADDAGGVRRPGECGARRLPGRPPAAADRPPRRRRARPRRHRRRCAAARRARRTLARRRRCGDAAHPNGACPRRARLRARARRASASRLCRRRWTGRARALAAPAARLIVEDEARADPPG